MKNFLRDLFLLPGKNGERRLVRHFFTKKMVWTKGLEPKFVENPEVKKVMQNTEDKKIDTTSFAHFEPIKNRRFVVDFPGIDSFIFKSYKFLGDDFVTPKKQVSEFHTYLPIAQDVDVDFYSRKSKKIGAIKILVLDTTGLVIRTIELENCYIEHVSVYEEFDYEKDDFQIMKLRVSHSPRKLS
jgi:hypothetical protein